MHRLLNQQLKDATSANGDIDLKKLLDAVARTYCKTDEERRGIVRSMQLMSEEAQTLTRELKESTSSQLQAILDHVKDVIITVDDAGRILSLNATGERVFGHSEPETKGRPLHFLVPALAEHESLPAALDQWAARLEDTHFDLASHETLGLHANGTQFPAEFAVSKIAVNRRPVYVVCLRDTTERKNAEAALRESEARYRVLVEHAPEIILVFDLDQARLIDVNENAVRFFKMERAVLLGRDFQLSRPIPHDGKKGGSSELELLEKAFAGTTPVFEWVFQDANGVQIPCEVRCVPLPSATRLLRCSVTDISERKRAELLAIGEKRIFERMAANVDLRITLEAITELVERVASDAVCAIRLLDEEGRRLTLCAGPNLPPAYVDAMDAVPVEARNGSCAAAVYLQRQVIVADITRDALWENRREAAVQAGFNACWSTLIPAADGRTVGTLALYFRAARSPLRRDFELMSRVTQLAGIAIERRHAEQALRASELRYRRLFDNVLEGVYSSTRDARFVSVNPALARMAGLASPEALIAHGPKALYANPLERDTIIHVLERDGEVRNAEFQLQRADGSTLTVIENARVVRDESGAIVGYEGTISDISERKRAEKAVFEEKEKAQITLESIGDAVVTTNSEGCVEYLNPVAEDLLGWTTREAAGLPLNQVLQIFSEHTREPVENPVDRCLREGRVITVADQTLIVNRRGQEISIQDSAAPIRDRAGHIIGAVMVFHDVSKERRLRRALAYQASHDALTGLINRREFENRLNDALVSVRANHQTSHVLLYLDLDQFKLVNDTCGHQAGDRLLKQITGVLQTRVRATDTLARLGGDEFGILLQDCTVDRAAMIADSLRQAIR